MEEVDRLDKKKKRKVGKMVQSYKGDFISSDRVKSGAFLDPYGLVQYVLENLEATFSKKRRRKKSVERYQRELKRRDKKRERQRKKRRHTNYEEQIKEVSRKSSSRHLSPIIFDQQDNVLSDLRKSLRVENKPQSGRVQHKKTRKNKDKEGQKDVRPRRSCSMRALGYVRKRED